jgi:UDP-N-acetylmuramoyl-tripeptide--D-alanyl-D-alanine ligase
LVTLWTSDEIAAATGGLASGGFAVSGVAFDSREVGEGDLFVALGGETTDGHRFLDQAFAQGAAGALVSRETPHPHVRVEDSFAGLKALGRTARERMDGVVVGVTGSVGKTSAKEALWAALERAAPGAAHRSLKSYNNHVGVPLSLARMPRDTRFGVFEMGMNHAGEIAELTRLVRPHIAIVTWVTSAHIEFFENEEGIADAKAEIFQGLEPGGTAILPRDNRHFERLLAAAKLHTDRIVTFGRGEDADVRVLEAVRVQAGQFVTARVHDRELSFTLAQPGAHWVMNALAVLAAVDAAGADLGLAGLALAELNGMPGRGERILVPAPGGQALLIDESYNANPASVRATLAVLADEPGRRIAVLGEMRELGRQSEALHAELAEPVLAARAELILLVGEAMAPLAHALEREVNVVHVADTAAATERLRAELRADDAVLVKGSNGVGLSRLVAALRNGA